MQQTAIRIQMINGKQIQTHRHPSMPKPDADLCMHMDLKTGQKLWKIRTGPSGCRAMGPAFSKTQFPYGCNDCSNHI